MLARQWITVEKQQVAVSFFHCTPCSLGMIVPYFSAFCKKHRCQKCLHLTWVTTCLPGITSASALDDKSKWSFSVLMTCPACIQQRPKLCTADTQHSSCSGSLAGRALCLARLGQRSGPDKIVCLEEVKSSRNPSGDRPGTGCGRLRRASWEG